MSWFKQKKKYPSFRHVVDGVIYDTNKATFLTMRRVRHIVTGAGARFVEFNEYIFKSHLGNFFLVMVPLSWTDPHEEEQDSTLVKVLTSESAFQWLSGNHEVALIEEYFPDRLRQG